MQIKYACAFNFSDKTLFRLVDHLPQLVWIGPTFTPQALESNGNLTIPVKLLVTELLLVVAQIVFQIVLLEKILSFSHL